MSFWGFCPSYVSPIKFTICQNCYLSKFIQVITFKKMLVQQAKDIGQSEHASDEMLHQLVKIWDITQS